MEAVFRLRSFLLLPCPLRSALCCLFGRRGLCIGLLAAALVRLLQQQQGVQLVGFLPWPLTPALSCRRRNKKEVVELLGRCNRVEAVLSNAEHNAAALAGGSTDSGADADLSPNKIIKKVDTLLANAGERGYELRNAGGQAAGVDVMSALPRCHHVDPDTVTLRCEN